MKKDNKLWMLPLFILVVLPGVLVLWFGRTLAVSEGKAAGEIYGFGVDSEENIYVATEKKIKVYRDGALIQIFDPPTNRAYALTVENDRIIIGCASDGKGGAYDLEGNELSYGDYSYSEIKRHVKHTVFVNGHEYRLRTTFGMSPYTVTRDGEIVVQAEVSFFEGLPYWCCLLILTLGLVALAFYFLSESAKKE